MAIGGPWDAEPGWRIEWSPPGREVKRYAECEFCGSKPAPGTEVGDSADVEAEPVPRSLTVVEALQSRIGTLEDDVTLLEHRIEELELRLGWA